MLNHKKILVVMPAYNAEKTLLQTCNEVPSNFVDEILLVDDSSSDNTVELAKQIGLTIFRHKMNMGYGRN
jgi:glycosyltransferase involved in cell wall biosynthesis